MVWGGITQDARTPLHTFNQGVNGQVYVDEILRPMVLPFLAAHPGTVFQRDDAPAHTARVSGNFLQHHNVAVLPWPARSPDLSPIEQVWSEMGRQLNQLDPPPGTLPQLRAALVRLWDGIPQQFIRNLVRSVDRRCNAVIQARGANTTYQPNSSTSVKI